MNELPSYIINDLLLDTEVIACIDTTHTTYGFAHLHKMFRTTHHDMEFLSAQQSLLSSLAEDRNTVRVADEMLLQLSFREPSAKWLNSVIEEDKMSDLYFGIPILDRAVLLRGYNFAVIYFSILSIGFYFLMYLYIRIFHFPLSLSAFIKGTLNAQYNFIDSVLTMVVPDSVLRSFLTRIAVNTYNAYQALIFIKGIRGSLTHYQTVMNFQKHYQSLRESMELIERLKDIFGSRREADKDFKIVKRFLVTDTVDFGYELISRQNYSKFKGNWIRLWNYIGEIDATIAIAKLLLSGEYTLPEYIVSSSPLLEIEGVWHPKLQKRHQVANDFQLGYSKDASPDKVTTMILTGANTSGKSTFMKTMMVSVIMAQTVGVAPAKSMRLTPFYLLHTYLNVPDKLGYESQYEAEMNRCMTYQDSLDRLQPEQFSLGIMDELFTGTDPVGGIAGSYGVCTELMHSVNSLQVISTHFHYLCRITDEYPTRFINKKFTIDIDDDGEGDIVINRDYMMKDGVSDQNIALKLLRVKGYRSRVLEVAERVAQQLNKSSMGYQNIIPPEHESALDSQPAQSPSPEPSSDPSRSDPEESSDRHHREDGRSS